MARRLKIGSVGEIPTPCGYAYLQYAHEHPMYGTLVRVLRGVYREAPADLGQLVGGPQRFWVLHPMAIGVREGLIRIVGLYDVPQHARRVPRMKKPLLGNGWAIVDDFDHEVMRTTTLSPEERNLPALEIWPYPDLIRNVALEWSWADDVEAAGAVSPATPCYDIGVPWPSHEATSRRARPRASPNSVWPRLRRRLMSSRRTRTTGGWLG